MKLKSQWNLMLQLKMRLLLKTLLQLKKIKIKNEKGSAMTVTATLVKELREKTSAGMLDCKKALEETKGDFDKAVEWLRTKGITKAEKKAGRIAAEGMVH